MDFVIELGTLTDIQGASCDSCDMLGRVHQRLVDITCALYWNDLSIAVSLIK